MYKLKIYNAFAQLLFCTLNLLFGDVLVGLCKVQTGWRRMADGGWRMADGG